MQEEIWKDIKEYESIYQASSFGRIRNKITNKIISQVNGPKGYLQFKLYKDNKPKTFRAHRVIIKTFIDNVDNKPQVNHKDCNKRNNHIDNLEWATQSENQLHAYRNNLKKPKFKKFSKDTIIAMRKDRDKLKPKQIASKYNMSYNNVRAILKGETWKKLWE